MKYHINIYSYEQLNILEEYLENISRIYIESILIDNPLVIQRLLCYKSKDVEIYITSPVIFRSSYFDLFNRYLNSFDFDGILIKNIEVLSYIINNYSNNNYDVVLDSNMYILNSEAFLGYRDLFGDSISEFYNSFELNKHEIIDLNQKLPDYILQSCVIYGRIPMMVSSNCVQKTMDNCKHNHQFIMLKDRMNKNLPIFCNCNYCYNIIFNSVPLSLHKNIDFLSGFGNLRIDFTNESDDEAKLILDYFVSNYKNINPVFEYTTGHFKRGVE